MTNNSWTNGSEHVGRREAYETLSNTYIPLEQTNRQNVFTPYELCKSIVARLEGYVKELKGRTYLCLNMELVEELLRKDVKPDNIWFLTDCPTKAQWANMDEYKGLNVLLANDMIDFLNQIKDTNMKFDIVMMNPPYNRKLHLAFLKMAMSVGKIIVSIQPAGWITCERKPKTVVEMIENKVQSIDLLDAKEAFKVNLGCLVGVFVIDSSRNTPTFAVRDLRSNKETLYSSIHDVNPFGDSEIYPSLKERMLKVARTKSLFDMLCTEGPFYVNLAKIRGNEDSPDLHTFVSREQGIESESRSQSFGFQTETEAANFLIYLKTKMARFCLSIMKSNLNMHQGELKSVPWMDFSVAWTDEKLRELWNINDQEWKLIDLVIPEYYKVSDN